MTIWYHNQDRTDQLTEHYDCIDENGHEYDLEPKIKEDENANNNV